MTDLRCTYCGEDGLQAGFILDAESPKGFGRWVEGALERGIFGGAKLAGRPKWEIEAHRCPNCQHLEMFARRRA
ncbi:hypothetical protein ACTMTF_21390 [Nonomuraea sp. ZG12]|uniref:hypothetical protein n=1 Tax=Nonomuraea sp. ZG12 TaxID=3452207 RepID=UPI003F8897CC